MVRIDLNKQLQQLDSALSTSFANLKRDFLEQETTIEELKARIAKQDKVLKQLSAKSAEQDKITIHLSAEIAKLMKPSKLKSPKTPVRNTPAQSSTGLTALHLKLLKHLMILQLESGRRYVSMGELASELYPEKSYGTIKATLSEYIKKLHQQGFVEKIRRGKLLLSFTENALQFADNQRLNRMRELISEPER